MAELRWILIVCGLVVIAGVYIYSRFRATPPADKPRREPLLDELEPGPANVVTADSSDRHSDAGSATPDKIVALRMMSRDSAGFVGDQLVLALREAGLRHGRYGIFHRHDDEAAGNVLFSVASLLEPGSFDLSGLTEARFPGVSIFMALPGEADPVQAFDQMLSTARLLAGQLEGDLLDEQGSTLSIQRQRFMREEVLQYPHQVEGAAGQSQ